MLSSLQIKSFSKKSTKILDKKCKMSKGLKKLKSLHLFDLPKLSRTWLDYILTREHI